MSNDKERYRRLCQTESSIPLFCRDWWQDAVCGENNWNVVLVERGGTIAGVLPYYLDSRYGLDCIRNPKLTQFTGPWLSYPPGQKYHSRLSFEKEILSELIDKLPPFDSFTQGFHYSVANWLPFCWKGFRQTTRYTYIIEDLSSPDDLFSAFRSNIKTDIRKAEKALRVVYDNDVERFFHLNKLTFDRQNLSMPYELTFLQRVDSACVERGCRKVFFAEGSDGAVHAAVYLVWDKQSAYYLMGGADPALRNSGATSLLLWEAIQFAATVTRKFDFEGSMLEPVERFFRSFGAVQKPYFHVSKVNSRLIKFQQFVKELVKG